MPQALVASRDSAHRRLASKRHCRCQLMLVALMLVSVTRAAWAAPLGTGHDERSDERNYGHMPHVRRLAAPHGQGLHGAYAGDARLMPRRPLRVRRGLAPKLIAPPMRAVAPKAPVPPANEVVESLDTQAVEVQADAEGPETWWTESWPVWDRIVDAHTPRTTRRHKFGTLFSHRNNGGFGQQPFHSLLGFDKGLLKVGLGLRYGIFEHLDVGLLRMNATLEVFNTYEFDVKYQLIEQKQLGIDLGARLGLSWFEQYPAKSAVGFFGQLLLGRLFYDRVYAGGGLLVHSSSSGPKKSPDDAGTTFALQAYADGRITRGFSFALELTRALAGYSLVNPAFTMSPRFVTNRHTFSIILSNTQYTTADGIITGSDRTRFSKWMLGFNITRELG